VAFAWAFLGAVRLGAVAVPVNPRLTEADHAAAAVDSGARVVVCDCELAGRFVGRPVITAGELEAGLDRWPPAPAVDVADGDPAYAQYTSGTTGVPKAAVHAHGHPLVYFDAFAGPAIALDRSDVVFSVSKLYFAYGLGNSLFFPLLAGCRAVLHAGRPAAADVADTVRRHRVTVLFSVPTSYAGVVAAGGDDAYASLRVAVSAGEPLGVPLARRARDFLGCPVLDGLGSTEVGQTFASNTLDTWRDGTVGRALPPYRVMVRDLRGRPLPRGEVGALWVAGPTLPLSAERFGEWMPTGDFAVLDADYFLHMRGRSDDVELVGGISVSPLEVEAVLSRHPGVSEVAVAGVVGEDGASRLRAFVVATAGAAGAGTESELLALARAELAPFKVPRSVTFVESLPRTPTGKLRRFVLRAGAQPATTAPKPAR
jgi:acyl-coenzyme A synthetase/AMP-(fatty) acid ligase